MKINKKTEPGIELKISNWELDFYSRPIRPFSRSISDIKAFIISPSLKTSRKERIDPFVSED